MELELRKNSFREYVPLFSKTLSAEETADAVVPDSKPDILRIADTRVFAEITGKDQRGGKVYFSGVAKCFVIYSPEGGGAPECIPVSAVFSVSADPGCDIPSGAAVRASVENVFATAREQNPRRVNVRISVRVRAEILAPTEILCCEDVADGESYGMELLCEDIETMCLCGMGEKLLNVAESAELGEIKVGGAEFLFWNLYPKITEVKLIPGKAVFKGEINVAGLLKTPEDGNSTAHISLSVPFSGVADCPGADTDAVGVLEARCFDSELSVSEETGTGRGILAVRTNVNVNAEIRRAQTLTAVTDAYSTTHDTKTSFSSAEFRSEQRRGSIKADVKEVLPAGIGIKTVYCADGVVEEAVLAEDGLSAIVRATVMFEGEDGGTYSVSKNIKASAPADEFAEGKIVSAVLGGESYRISSTEEVEFSATVEAWAEVERTEAKNILSSLSVSDREIRGRTPSLTLCGILEGESWWELGKRMRASADEIMAANGIEEGDPPGDRMLLIPKKAACRKRNNGGVC